MSRELIAVTLDIRLSEVAVDVSCGAMDGIDVAAACLHRWALNLHHQR